METLSLSLYLRQVLSPGIPLPNKKNAIFLLPDARYVTPGALVPLSRSLVAPPRRYERFVFVTRHGGLWDLSRVPVYHLALGNGPSNGMNLRRCGEHRTGSLSVGLSFLSLSLRIERKYAVHIEDFYYASPVFCACGH